MLSSLRPLCSALFRILYVTTSSLASNHITPFNSTTYDITSFHPVRLSSLRGNPSIKNVLSKPFSSIAILISVQVIFTGTIFPSAIY